MQSLALRQYANPIPTGQRGTQRPARPLRVQCVSSLFGGGKPQPATGKQAPAAAAAATEESEKEVSSRRGGGRSRSCRGGGAGPGSSGGAGRGGAGLAGRLCALSLPELHPCRSSLCRRPSRAQRRAPWSSC